MTTNPKTIVKNVFTPSLFSNPIKNKVILSAFLGLAFLATDLTVTAQTAKEKLSQLNNAAHNMASDAQLVFITGDDLNLSGESDTWIYDYKSESQGKVYEFWFEDGSIKQKSTISQWDEFQATKGMSSIPDNCMDSNEALNIAEANGGSIFRTSHGGNAAIRMSLIPSALGSTGSIPLLHKEPAWEFSYRSNDNYFDITINAQTGAIITREEETAKGFYSIIDSLAKEYDPNVKLYKVWSPVVNLEGKSGEWNYEYHSISRHRTFLCRFRNTKISREAEWNAPDHNYTPMIELDYNWMDSDSAIIEAESKGGEQFRNSHSNWEINTHLFVNETELPKWEINYQSPTGTDQFNITAIRTDNMKNKAQTRLEQVTALAKTYANDAELVFVTAGYGNISETGDGQWNYVFKSVAQQEIYEFYSTINGFIALSEGVTSFFSKEDFLNAQPFPELWIGIDSALIITENSGGFEFRQNYPDWSIQVFLFFDWQVNKFEWDINYNSEITGQRNQFFINAKILHKVLVKELLHEADSLVKSIDPGAKLVYLHATNVDLEGKATVWKYYFKSSDNQEIYQVNIDNGDVFEPMEFSAPVSMEFLLGCEAIQGNWINSDSVITIVEGEGGFEFREEHPDWEIIASMRLRDGYSEPSWRIMYEPGREVFWVNAINPFPSTDWPKTYGGENSDIGLSVHEASDGGFIIAGTTSSFGAGKTDPWLLKTNKNGLELWNKTLGNEFSDIGGYAVVTESDDILFACAGTNNVEFFASLYHFDSSGNEKLGRNFWTEDTCMVKSVYKTSDNHYLLAGSVFSGETEKYDFWLIKIDENGNAMWRKTFGGTGNDICESMELTNDGSCILFGTTNSYGSGEKDFWLVKIDNDGNQVWDKTYGGNLNEVGKSLDLTSDGGFILAGSTESFGRGGQDFYLIKSDKNGDEVWSKTFGTTDNDYAAGVLQCADGGYAIVGTTEQNDTDIMIVKTDTAGNETWHKKIGGDQADFGEAICETKDGNFAVTGSTYSWGVGQADVILMKVDNSTINSLPELQISSSGEIPFQIYPNPFSDETKISLNIRKSGKYKIRIIDLAGREISILLNGYLPKGRHEIKWSGKSDSDKQLISGIYLIELSGDIKMTVRKIFLNK